MNNNNYSLHAVSLDSRSRVPGMPDNHYRISLGKTFDNVRSVQLASFQFQENRLAVPHNSFLYVSEPLTVPPNTRLNITETVSTLNKLSNTTTTTSRTYSLLLPPTLNALTNYLDAGSPALDTLTTEYPHGLAFGVRYYPVVSLPLFIAGGDFPTNIMAFPPNTTFPTGAGPILNTATVRAPYVGSTGLDNEFQYVDDYMTELTGSALGHAQRHFLLNTYTSFVIATKPTLSELMIMLNAALNDLLLREDVSGTVINASNTSPIVITSGANHGLVTGDQIVVSGVGGNTGANGTFFVTVLSLTTLSLNGSAGNAAFTSAGTWTSPQTMRTSVQFGINDESSRLFVNASPRDIDTRTTKTLTTVVMSGHVMTMLGFAENVQLNSVNVKLPTNVQSYPIRQGTYSSAVNMASMLTDQMQILEFFTTNEDERRFVYSTAAGWIVNVVVESGFYTGPQMAAHLNVKFQAIGATVRASFDITTRRFTFTNLFQQNWVLDMTIMNARFTFMLGFYPIRYAGCHLYTSDFPIISPPSGIPYTSVVYPQNAFVVTANEIQKSLSINVKPRDAFWTQDGVYVANVGAEYTTTYNSLCVPFAHRYTTGDVLYAQQPALSGIITAATSTAPSEITSVGHGLTTGDRIAILCLPGISWLGCVFSVTVTGVDTFLLDGSDLTGSTYTSGAEWMSVTVGGVEPPIFTVVVRNEWDPAAFFEPVLSLYATPTTNMFGITTPTNRVVFHNAERSVFQLHFSSPEGVASSLGFPAVTWPPTSLLSQTVLPSYWNNNAAPTTYLTRIPLASGYTSPFAYTLLPTDYIFMRLHVPSQDNNVVVWKGNVRDILAKLYVSWPFLNISDELNVTVFANSVRLNEVTVSFENPDGTPVDFNGSPHSFTLIINARQNGVALMCQ